MKLIVGLGNPGKKYENTRHNIGFAVVGALADKLGLAWRESARMKSTVAKGADLILAKPATYMNNSGFAAAALLKYYKLEPADLIVVHDEFDLPFGKLKISTDSRSAGHNGVQSIIDQLGTKKFCRYRFGIKNDLGSSRQAEKFVLDKFTADETKALPGIIDALIDDLLKSGE